MENGVLVRQCDDAHGPAVPARTPAEGEAQPQPDEPFAVGEA